MERPPNVYGKPLASGQTLWSWQPSSKDRKKNCPLKYRALGTDPVEAFQIARELNQALKDWRNGVQAVPYMPGSFGWLLIEFLEHKDIKALSKTARDEYERHARYMMALSQDGISIEKKMLETFTALFAYNLYNKIARKHSVSIANRCLMMARYAWNKMYILHERLIPETNPFEKLEASHHEVEETVPASYDQLLSFTSAALALGELGLAIGARMCWDFTVRPTETFGSMLLSQWRPPERPHHVWIGVDKTSKGKRKKSSTWQPIDEWVANEDGEGGEWVCLFPELEDLIRLIKWREPPNAPEAYVCMRERQKGLRVFSGDWQRIKNADKIARRIREHAGLPDYVTLEAFRHGGLTELGDAEVPDTLAKAISRHRHRGTLDRYIHRTDRQVVTAQKMRLAHRKDI